MNASDLLMLMLGQATQIALLYGVIRLTLRIVGGRRPFLSHTLWAILLLKCVTPPIWSSSLGVFSQFQLPLPVQGDRAQTVEASSQRITGESIDNEPTSLTQPSELFTRITVAPAEDSSLPRVNQPKGSVSALPPASTPHRLAGALLIIWTCGVLFFGLRLFAQVMGFLARLRAIPRRECPEIESRTTALARRLGIRRIVRIEVIEGDIGPAVLGWLRPRILVPAVLVDRASRRSLDSLIAHELVHLRRGDLWWAGLQEFARCLWWFHPAVRSAAKSLTVEAEKSCDQETIASLACKPAEYARCLLDVLEQKHKLRSAPAFPGVRAIDITTERMERIMNTDVKRVRYERWWFWPLLALSCLIILPGAQRLTADDPPVVSSNNGELVTENEETSDDSNATDPKSEAAVTKTVTERTDAKPAVAEPFEVGATDAKPDGETVAVGDNAAAARISRFILQGNRAINDRALKTQLGLQASDALTQLNVESARQRMLDLYRSRGFYDVEINSSIGIRNDPTALIFRINEGLRKMVGIDQSGQLYTLAAPSASDTQVPRPVAVAKPLPRLPQRASDLEDAEDLVHVETRMLLIPTERWHDLEIDWSANGSTPPNSTKHQPSPSVTPPADDPETTDSARPEPLHPDRVESETEPEVGRQDRMGLVLLDDDPTRRIIETVEGSRVLSMPTVLTINGRAVTVEVGRMAPRLPRMKEDSNGHGDRTDKSIQLGTKLKLTPTVVDRRYVRLDLDLSVTRSPDVTRAISDVELKGVAERNGRVTLQASYPKIAVTAVSQLQTTFSLPLDQHLAIGGLSIEDRGQSFQLLCVIDCRLVTKKDETEASNHETASQPGLALPSLPAASAAGSSSRLECGPFALLGKTETGVEIHGDVRVETSSGKTVIEVNKLRMRWTDGDELIADHGIITATNDQVSAVLDGNVKIQLGSRRLAADHVKIVDTNVVLERNVRVSSGEMKFSASQLQLVVDDE